MSTRTASPLCLVLATTRARLSWSRLSPPAVFPDRCIVCLRLQAKPRCCAVPRSCDATTRLLCGLPSAFTESDFAAFIISSQTKGPPFFFPPHPESSIKLELEPDTIDHAPNQDHNTKMSASSSESANPNHTPQPCILVSDLSVLDPAADEMDSASNPWMMATVIEDDDLMFGGKPLCAWYEEDRRRLSLTIDEEETRGRQRERARADSHHHHHKAHHQHHHHQHQHQPQHHRHHSRKTQDPKE